MPPAHLPIPPAPPPTRKTFDPWNSSSTGHQHAENRLSGSTSWRASRTLKLGNQFSSSEGGGKRLYDTVGAGSKDFGKDGRKENGSWEVGAAGLREKGWRDIGVMMTHGATTERDRRKKDCEDRKEPEPATQSIDPANSSNQDDKDKPPQIFAGLTIYINGSTFPLISDHKLKHLLASHGATISLALARRSVTHVILGNPNGARGGGGGAGGGLSGRKLQKEVQRVRGKGVKYVGVEWVLECLKQGKRVGEGGFGVGGGVVVGRPVGVRGVGEIFGVVKKREGEDGGGEEEKGKDGE